MIRAIVILCVAFSLCGPTVAETATVGDFRSFLDAWEGRWSGEVNQGGEKLEAIAVCHRVPGDHALIAPVYADDWSGIWMVTHDASSNRIRTLWSCTNGETSYGLVYKGNEAWHNESRGTSGGGSAQTHKNTIKVTDGGDGHRWDFTATSDESTTTYSSIWKRVER
jgi:hypothetical protein